MVRLLMNVGTTIYGIDVLITTWLVVLLLGKARQPFHPSVGMAMVTRRWTMYPYFTAYTLVRLIQCSVLFPLFVFGSMNTYSRFYWRSSPAMLFFQMLVLCDLFPRGISLRKIRIPIRRMIYCLALGFLVLQFARPSQATEDWAGALVAIVTGCILIFDHTNLLAMGFVVALVFPIISTTIETLSYGDILRFVPTLSFFIAQLIWMRAITRSRFRNSEEHRKSGSGSGRTHQELLSRCA